MATDGDKIPILLSGIRPKNYSKKKKKQRRENKGPARGDRTGEIEARVWERADELSGLFGEGDILEVEGYASSYRGQVQVTLSGLKAMKEVDDPGLFLEVTPKDITKMMASLREILRGIKNPHVKALVDRFLSDRHFVSQFKKAPAARR